MLVVCLDCAKRHEVPKSKKNLDISCSCGQTLTVQPWVSYRRVLTEDKKVECPKCSQIYDFNEYRENTEIACPCGSLLVFRHEREDSSTQGRRKSDQSSQLREVELRGLVDTSRLIHSSIHNLDQLLLLIMKITAEMLDVEGSTVVLRDKHEGGLVFHAITGEKSSKLTRFRLAEGEGIAGNCVENQTSIMVNSVQSDPRFSNRADATSGFTTRSILCIPLIVEKTCIGALEVVNKVQETGFNDHDLLLGEAVAGQIAIAIHNIRLHEEAIKAARLAAIGQAVTGVAHCVKNMLNGLQGGLFILKQQIHQEEGEVPDQGFSMLERNQGRLADLVQDMLTYSKERIPEYELTDLNELVESVVELMKAKAGEHDVELYFEPAQELQPVEIDSKGIYRSILNLVSNAIDACDKEHSVVSVRLSQAGNQEVVIQVTDQGCGMNEETCSRIFHPFFSKKGSKGTGLGLSITQKIVQEHHGRIEVESTLGQGTVFRMFS